MIFWFTGQPGSGKTTLALELMKNVSSPTIHIDGDDLRDIFVNKDYSEQGRRRNIERAQDLALFLHRKGYTVFVSLVSPYKDQREGFRPFAPMVIQEKQHLYFDMETDIPYMNQIVRVKSKYARTLTEITHTDNTARVQTVYKDNSIYDLLLKVEELTGYPILLNTSFNIKDKTMVLTPFDAVSTFYDTEMDLLVIGNYIILKK